MKKNKLSKSAKIFLLSSAVVIGAGAAAAATILVVNKKIDIKYSFNNQIFNTKEEIYDYAYSQAKNTNYNFENLKFLIDDNAFNTRHEFEEYISQNYPINAVSTIKDPSSYLINNSGELSPLVLTNNGEEGINTYKGINGDAYLSRDAALASYLKSYEEKYLINGFMFDNLYSAKNYYEEAMIERLEEMEPIHVYRRGGVQYEEQEIKSWLRSTIKRGFQYNGKSFSDYNYREFLEAMKDLDSYIIDTNIKPVLNGDRASFWGNFSTYNPLGYFVGPKYIESNESPAGIINFEVTDSQDGNAILDIFKAMALSELISNSVDDRVSSELEWKEGTKFIDYLESIFNDKTLNLDELPFKNFKDFFGNLGLALQDDADTNLSNIDDEELTDFHKTLIVFKRLLLAAKIYDLKDASGDKYPAFENSIKKVVVELLKTQKKMMNKLFNKNGENSEDWIENFSSDAVSFDTIYNLFLNTQAFYEDGGILGKTIGGIQNAFEILDNVISTGVAATGGAASIIEGIDKLSKSQEKSDGEFNKKSSEIQEQAQKKIGSKAATGAMEEGLEIVKSKKDSFLGFTNIVSGIWSISNMLSFISFVSAEAKIDSHTSIYYYEPQFHLPFDPSRSLGSKVSVKLEKLVPAPLERMAPVGEDGKPQPIYEFNNRYYLDKNIAIKSLIDAIYLNPSRYLPTTELLTSGYGDTWSYEIDLPEICQEGCSENHEHITQAKYNQEIAKETEKFIDYLFDEYFKLDPSNTYYPDGFGEFWPTRPDAIGHLREKVEKSENYKKVYSYKINDQVIIKNSLDEIIDFIKENQLIETKKVINSDLITTMVFDKLEDYFGQTYEIYELLFYGGHKYFRTRLEAEKFLKNNLNWKALTYSDTINTYQYLDWDFFSKNEFDYWIEARITEEK